jgi:signal transduction histidine kinase/ligand-binding sensor domain-containing protein/AraC-like DNA-binding protein
MFDMIQRRIIANGLIVMMLFSGYEIGAQNNENFINLSVNDGLSQSTIFSIHQDSKGFMWFGTRGGGLNKYDGYGFQVYMSNPDEEGSISENVVLSLLEDSQGLLWVGCHGGTINSYDLNTGKFQTYQLHLPSDFQDSELLGVREIYEDRSGVLWIGTDQHVYIFNRETNHFDPVMSEAPFPIKGTRSICEDEEGYYYFATWDRLVRYHPENKSYDQLLFPPKAPSVYSGRVNTLLLDSGNRLWLGTPGGLRMVDLNIGFSYTEDELAHVDWPAPFNSVRTIKETRDGQIWFGTIDGLYAYNPETYVLKEYRTIPYTSESLVHNSIYSIFEDHVGSLWIGTWSGLSILDKRKYNFRHYAHLPNNPQGLSNNVVSSFQEDSAGLWVGTEQGGLNFLNRDRTEFKSYKHIEGDPESLPSNNVKTVYKDSNNDLWVGTFNGGISLHLGDGRFKNYLKGHSVYSMAELRDGKLYFGGRTGLYVMDLANRNISRKVFSPSTGMSSLETFVTALYADSNNRIWIGTRSEGIYLYDPMRFILKQFQSSKSDSSTISDNRITSITEDNMGIIWIGTAKGLNKFINTTSSFDRMNERIGIKDRIINGLQVDDNSKLWISTTNGIYSYDLISNEIRHFDYQDGLQSNEFNPLASFKNSKGELFFGGVKGFNVFHPDKIEKNMDPPPVVITDLKLFNKSVLPGEENSPLSKHISETEKIVLTHLQSSFSFEFVALNYLIPEKNTYSYILEGFEDEWNNSGRVRTASYMNLDPGKYTFRVRGSNNDGVWNEAGASVDIVILAPFWATPFAVLIYTVILTVLLFGLIKLVKYRTEKENELRLMRAEKLRIKELNESRLQYFTNISHEFRTPLTLIAGPLDKLISGKYTHQSEYLLQLMKSNVNRMLRLVNQLMDFRKLENNKMPLRIQQKNMDKFLSQIVLGFEDLASKKMIELRYNTDSKLPEGSYQWFDIGILDKVIYNLLSNAFKFCSEHGIIEVNLTTDSDTARIEIIDTGKGIDPAKIKRIFDRFYSDSPDLYSSTGIGLSLSKRLIDLHKGTIEVESEKGKGAKFIVTFPINKESFSPEEMYAEVEGFVFDRPQLDSAPGVVPLEEAISESVNKNKLVLIVEDNPEMLSYLANHLIDYEILKAENGKIALELAKAKIPDIIISDIMMPEMNGIEFCKAVKKEFLTSHIPVILLSAKASIAEKIEGVETAEADAYLEKPFDSDYLSAIIRNLLLQRKKLKEKFSGLTTDDLLSNVTADENELFLQKINQIVLDNILDLSFSVDHLLTEIGMSRSQLYRKFKAISDKSPSEYIRILKLQYACKLLNTNGHSINEIAYMSGFGNVSYFNTCFKRHYGVSPGKFLSAKTD